MKMSIYKKIILNINKNNLFFFIYIPVTAVFFVWGLLLILYPETAAEGISEGINLCVETVVPSLFPFLLFSSVLSESGVLDKLIRICDKIADMMFKLPGTAVPIIFMSMIGGYPVGAFLIKRAFEKKELTASQGRRMLVFCVNPGPAFAVSAVGSMLIGSQKAGLIIYASTVISSLLLGVLTRFVSSEESISPSAGIENPERKDIYTVISESVNSGTRAIVNICMWIIVFSCLNGLIEKLPLNQSFVQFFYSFSEVTNGVITVLKSFPVPLASGVISFSGFCVHLQILPCIASLKMKYKHFLTARIIAASLSTMLSYLLFKTFPISINTVSLGEKPTDISLGSSVPVCVCLLIMCGLFIIGDNYIFKNKTARRADN